MNSPKRMDLAPSVVFSEPILAPIPRKFTREQIENSLIQGDCIEMMKKIPDGSVDMVLCDLPYGTTQNKWDSVIPLELLWQQYERIIRPNGVIALTSQGIFTAKLMMSNEKLFKYKLVWVKSKATNFLNAKKQPLRKHEDVCIFYRNHIYTPTYHPQNTLTYNPQMREGDPYNKGVRKSQQTGSYGLFDPIEVKSRGGRYPTDVIEFKTAESEGRVYHPTQKPVELGKYLIRTYTNKGDLVLDNTFGSGSFLVSALQEGRKFVGIELNDDVILHRTQQVDMLDIAKKRLLQEKPDLTIRIYGRD